MPITILDAVSSMCLKFLWGSKNSKVKWDDVCAPKEEGGLGLKNTKVWNKALLSRTLWNIHANAETLWVRWVHSYYLKGSSIWDFVPKYGDSYLIKEIVKIRNELEVAFGGRDRAIAGLSRFVVGSKFLSGKVYDVLRVARVKKPWMSCIWKHFIPPKHSFTVWLACRGRLPTKDRLTFLNLDDVSCYFCRSSPESIGHIFFGCPFTSVVWAEIRRWLGVTRDMSTLASAIKWIKKEFKGSNVKNRAVRIAFSSTIFEVWAARNVINFDGGKVSTQDIIARVKTTTYRILYRLNPHCRLTF
ncbi:hypothetical protein LIER_37684 [Lithospermum erythrorhizon]|uniref:Reverse transcriptase zinc-binding domain-containing protein n=1 Tax=Lithospermum erythrorhizon TaxID=34254 RepID=A0AAV3PT17_LITER